MAWGEVDWTRFTPVPRDGGRLDPLRPIAVKSAADEVFERLVTAFALGLYPPGHRLPPERELAERLGVSRVTVREALARLDALGYVETRRGRYGGTMVTNDWPAAAADVVHRVLEPSWQRFEELFDLSRQLIPVFGRLAAERRTDEDLARIDAARVQYEEAVDREEIRAGDRAFHGAISLAAHNSMLTAAGNQLRAQLTLGVDAFPYSQSIHDQAVADHRQIVDAIAARDDERAATLVASHFVELAEVPFRQLYERAARPARRRRRGR